MTKQCTAIKDSRLKIGRVELMRMQTTHQLSNARKTILLQTTPSMVQATLLESSHNTHSLVEPQPQLKPNIPPGHGCIKQLQRPQPHVRCVYAVQ
jgi:hypothetical protein